MSPAFTDLFKGLLFLQGHVVDSRIPGYEADATETAAASPSGPDRRRARERAERPETAACGPHAGVRPAA